MNRFYVPAAEWKQDRVSLSGDEGHHCAKVFRHRVGDSVEVFDGEGRSAFGRIAAISNRSVDLELGEQTFTEPLPVSITLIQAVPKAKTMDLIVQKASEIGAATIIPVQTERTVVKLADEAKKQAKWQRIALESCKQCGRNWLPNVSQPISLGQAIEADKSALRLVAALSPKSKKLGEIVTEAPESLSLAIGPEGDFSAEELEMIDKHGFHPMSLGPTVLRSETAAIYALSVVSNEFLEGTATL